MLAAGAVMAAAATAAAAAMRFPPGWQRMALLVAALFAGFKAVSLPRAGAVRTLLYVSLWPGMGPAPFEAERRPDRLAGGLLWRGFCEAAAGVALLGAGAASSLSECAKAWLSIGGALVTVHLGLFDMLAGAWRRIGFPVGRICPSPWRSRSLSEFWGRRWNMAFHIVMRDRVYGPIGRRWGNGPAVAAVFLLSGVLHELVISVPAGGGYGLPTLYFALHGLIVMAEKRGAIAGGRWLTAAAVLGPLPILFHPWFVNRVVVPWVA